MNESLATLPWRGPGPDRPRGLALPPDRLPIRRRGVWRKQWRYVAAFADEALVCAARIKVGPVGQTFWVVWDRAEQRMWEGTKLRLPGGRGEVWTEVASTGGVRDHAPSAGATVRIEARHPEAGPARGFLRFDGGTWVEAVCPTGERDGYVWTRKRVDVPVEVDFRVGERRLRFEGRGVEDESEGYHPKHTVWTWSAGVGRARDGRSVGWNLIGGVNDPPQRSERAIWIDGEPFEPPPVTFSGLDAVEFGDGARLELAAECERRRQERKLFVDYSYRQPLGSFSGSLPGGIELERGLGVIEHHDARW